MTKKERENFYRKSVKCFFYTAIGVLLLSCNKDDDNDEDLGNWITSSTFDGVARSRATSFVIQDKGYVGCGYDGDNYLNDFWEYDINGGYWVQRADFPGVERSLATGFSIGNYGFIGTGYDGENELKDFYKYDSTTNTWTQIANFGQDKTRRSAVGFSSDAYGYVGCGYDGTNDKKDFWRYDPSTDTWTELFGFGGNKRRDAVTFKINNKIYFGTGTSNGLNLTDFWSFDPTDESWTKLNDITDTDDNSFDNDYTITRGNAVGFTLGNYGYICTGNPNVTTWEYNPTTDRWNKKTTFEGNNRLDACAISNGQRAFVVLGRSGNLYFDDMYEFKPFDEQVDND
ncbi:kelch repeat-containing protein [Flavobacterium sp.]|jgi:N-acetylneuraminic acid mutarotase|uniref:Kelch repeat-containing protein n=1 Tax=Flavobacterium sp. TaxID=239 RepID=UPI0037833898